MCDQAAVPGQPHAVDCAVIIVTFNSGRHIGPLLDCLPAAAAGLTMRVIVVDNGSRDDTVARVRAYPGVTCIQARANLGYAGGINVGRKHSGECATLAILNPDLVLEPGSLRAMFDAFDDPGIGVVVPALVDHRGTVTASLRREPSLTRHLGDALLGSYWGRRPAWLTETVRDERDYARRHAVDWAGGAAMLVSASCDRVVGDWDEQFFLYMEEVDYAARVRAAGWRVEYAPRARARHRGAGSGSSPALTALMAVNRIRYFEKQGRPVRLLRAVVLLSALLRSWDPGQREAVRTVARRSSWPPLIAGLKTAGARSGAAARARASSP